MRVPVLLCCCALALLAESAAGLHWTTPAGWKNEGSRPMRAATYQVPLAPDDRGVTDCAAYFFGPGQGGTVELNLERWKSQILGPDGKPAAAQIRKRAIHGVPVTTIDSSGGYTGMGGPTTTGQKAVPGYRLLGAIVEGPGGNVFIKFTGPAKTVAQNQPKFEQMLASFEPR
jgi:hypothetical protein